MTNLHRQAKRWAQQYGIAHLSRRDVLQRVLLIAAAGPAALVLLRKIGVPVAAAAMSRTRSTVERTSAAAELLRCSFCDKDEKNVRKVIAGPSVFICDECVEVCNAIIADTNKFTKPPRKPPGARVRRDLQRLYNRASAATLRRKSFADAEAIHAWLDAPECVYKLAGQPWRTWAEMRPFVEAELLTPCQDLSNRIDTIELDGDQAATQTGVSRDATIVDHAGQFGPAGEAWTVRTIATVRDIWIKTPLGWRRKSHEKIDPDRAVAVMGTRTGII